MNTYKKCLNCKFYQEYDNERGFGNCIFMDEYTPKTVVPNNIVFGNVDEPLNVGKFFGCIHFESKNLIKL